MTRTSFRSYHLPKRSDIEPIAQRLFVVLTSWKSHTKNVPGKLGGNRDEHTHAATALSNILLRPALPLLNGKRIAIIADEVLAYVPFGALAEPGDSARRFMPLIRNHEIINLLSASILFDIRKHALAGGQGRRSVIVFADPVYAPRTARWERTRITATDAHNDKALTGAIEPGLARSQMQTHKAIKDIGLLALPQLPFTRQEATYIHAAAKNVAVKLMLGYT